MYNLTVSSLSEGNTVSVDCHKCDDTRGRLYYTRKDNKLVFYCHNCGYKGATRNPFAVKQEAVRGSIKAECKLPSDVTYLLPNFPAPALSWLSCIPQEKVVEYKICYSQSMNRLIMPFYNGDGLAWMNCRSFDVNEKRKYLLYKRIKHKPIFYTNNYRDNAIVICEDMLSAIKVSVLGLTGIASMGVGLDQHGFGLIRYLDPAKVYIFYDNDNAEVKRGQNKLKKELQLLLSCDTSIIRHNKDPKECSVEELKHLLGE